MKNLLSIICLFVIVFTSNAQFSADTSSNATLLAQQLAGSGVTISNATINCATASSGTFMNAPTDLGFTDGVILSSGNVIDLPNGFGGTDFGIVNPQATQASTDMMTAGDADLLALYTAVGSSTNQSNDACALEFDIEVTGDSLKFNYAFGSEEYDEFVCDTYADIFAFFISGPNPAGGTYTNQNVALVPGTTTAVTVNTVNNGTSTGTNPFCETGNNTYFFNQAAGGGIAGIVYDGMTGDNTSGTETIPLQAVAATVPCQTYHFKLVIGDGQDNAFDSGVFLEAGSFSSNAVVIGASSVLGEGFDEAVEGCVDGIFSLKIDTIYPIDIMVGFNISGTATNGTDYVLISDSVLVLAGDSTVEILIDVIADGILEGTETVTLTPYTECGTLGDPSTLEIVDDYPHTISASDTSLCSPTNITLTGTGAQFYQWSDATLLNNSDSSMATTINPVSETTTFYLEGILGTCTFTDSVTVEVTTTVVVFDSTAISCPGANDGQQWAVVDSNAIQPISYSFPLSGGLTDSVLTGISSSSPGFSLLTVTDGLGCEFSSGLIFFPDATSIVYSFDTVPVSCTGAEDGQICLYNLSNGTYTANIDTNGVFHSNYSFTINSDTFCMSSLGADTYSVSFANDTTGCTDTFSVTLADSPIACSNFYSTNLTCANNNTGSICVFGLANGNYTASGTYNTIPFPPSNFTMNSDSFCLDNLPAGAYDITITDLAGFNANYIDTITEPDTLVTNISIFGPDLCAGGSIDSLVSITSGGTTPYFYDWDAGSGPITANYFDAPFGVHSILVTDINGCIDSATVTIIEPDGMYINIAQDSALCFGGNDGLAYIDSISGGTLPYTFSWNDPLLQSTDSAFNLLAGEIILTVTDSGNCVITDTIIVEQPDTSIQIALTTTGIPCFGDTTCIDATVSGGTPPYTFNWNTGAIIEDICGLDTGNYILTVTDAHGCIAIDSILISQPDTLVSAITVMGTGLCAGGTIDSLVSVVTGGTLNYTYEWSNGPTTANITGVAFGNYTLVVTDANSCIDSTSVTIVAPTPLFLNIEQDSALCFNGNSGTAYLDSVSGGNPPYTYSWNDALGQTTDTASSLTGGMYVLTVTDLNSCTIQDSVEVLQPADSVSITLSSNLISCFGGDTCIDAFVSGGVAPYTFLWDDALAQTTEDVCGIAAGTYTLVVTDANGCTNSASITVNEVDQIVLTMDSTNIDCYDAANGVATVSVAGGSGAFTYLWDDALAQTTASISNLAPGLYTVIVTDVNNTSCTETASINVTQPTDSISVLLANLQDVLCNGAATGSIDVNISGGTSPYTYAWSNSTSNEDLTGAVANSYTLTVTDANLCPETFTDIIDQPTALVISLDSTSDVSCFGGNDGDINISITGGIAPYTYSWDSGQNTEDVSGLTNGSYTVTVTDFNNCTIVETYTIDQPSNVSISFNYTNISCNGLFDGTIEALVTGGNAPYTYSWDNGSSLNPTTGLGAGLVNTVTVTDNSGCTYTQAANALTEPSVLVVGKDSTDLSCPGFNDGTATAIPSGGTSPYTFTWSDPSNQTTAVASNLAAGTYNCVVLDANNCSEIIQVTVSEAAPIIVTTSSDSVRCWGDSDGTLTINASGGNGSDFEYSIDGGVTYQNSDFFDDLTAGVYSNIIVRQGGETGCTSNTVSETVFQPDPMFIFINPEDTTIQLEETVPMTIVVDPATSYFGNVPYSLNDIVSISWTPTNGLSCTDCTDPTSLVFDDTEYTATVLYSPYLCETSASATINVENNLKFFIPNSFSPNGDGINDIHYVYGEGLKDFSMAIYNRWGEKVFDSATQTSGWDGTFKGALQNPSVFTYYFKATYLDDKEIDLKGSITILR